MKLLEEEAKKYLAGIKGSQGLKNVIRQDRRQNQNGQSDIFEISSQAYDTLPCKRSGDFPDLPPQKTRKIAINVYPASSCHKNLLY